MADMGVCACPGCENTVTSEEGAFREGQAYCCTGCAAGHPEGLDCLDPDCPCNELNRPPAGEEVREEPSEDQF